MVSTAASVHIGGGVSTPRTFAAALLLLCCRLLSSSGDSQHEEKVHGYRRTLSLRQHKF
jgi:hypothetical protein